MQCGGPVASPDGLLKLLSGKQAEVNYGQNHCVLCAQPLPEKDIEVDLGGTKREGHRVQLSKKEVGLSGKAIGLSQALFHP